MTIALWAASAAAQGPPAHDVCADAIALPPSTFSDTATTTEATTDAADPTPSCGNGSRGKSVWYRFTAPGAPGTLTAHTFGSDYDTILSVYDGPCDTLSPIPNACNDDDPRDGAQSRVTIQTGPSATYAFMVSAYDDDGGELVFTTAFQFTSLCVGDCDGDGSVDASECAACQRIQDGEPLALCPSCDEDGDGQVAMNEVNQCRLGMQGCIRCGGDCDGSGTVTASDLVTTAAIIAACPCGGDLGGIALGCPALPTVVTACASADRDTDGCIAAPERERVIADLFRCG